MIEQLVNYFIETFLKHRAVKYSKYQNRVYTNAQNNNAYMQANIDTDPYGQLLTSQNNLFTYTFNIDVLGFPTKEYTVMQCQSDALTICVEFIQYIKNDLQWMGQLDVRDYSFLALDEYTDDKAAGQRMTIELIVPNPINLCEWRDDFDEDQMQLEETDDIDLKDVNPPSKSNDLVLRPILIPSKK